MIAFISRFDCQYNSFVFCARDKSDGVGNPTPEAKNRDYTHNLGWKGSLASPGRRPSVLPKGLVVRLSEQKLIT